MSTSGRSSWSKPSRFSAPRYWGDETEENMASCSGEFERELKGEEDSEPGDGG